MSGVIGEGGVVPGMSPEEVLRLNGGIGDTVNYVTRRVGRDLLALAPTQGGVPAGLAALATLPQTAIDLGTAGYNKVMGTEHEPAQLAHIPYLGPSIGAVEQAAEANVQHGKDVATRYLPVPPPPSPAAEVMGDVASTFVQLAIPLPGTKYIPTSLARGVVRTALPGAPKLAGVGAGILGGAEVALGVHQPKNSLDVNAPVPDPVPEGDPNSTRVESPTFDPAKSTILPSLGPTMGPDSVVLPPIAPEPAPGTDTWWDRATQYGTITGVAVGAAVLAVGAKAFGAKTAELTKTLRESAYAEASAPRVAQDARIAAGEAVPTAERVEAPLPGVTKGGLMQGSVQDRAAPLKQWTDALAENPTQGKVMRAWTGLTNNDTAMNLQTQEFVRTGVDPHTGLRMPAPVEHWRALDALAPEVRANYSLMRWYANELDNRDKMWRLFAQGKMPEGATLDQMKYDFKSIDTGDMFKQLEAAKADPVLGPLLDEAWHMNRRMLDVYEARGAISAEQKSNILRDHQRYLSTVDQNGVVVHTFGERELVPGGGHDVAPTTAWEIDKQHMADGMRLLNNNTWLQQVVPAQYAYQSRVKGAAEVFKEARDAQGNWMPIDSSKGVQVRIGGETQYHYVNNPWLLRQLTNTPTASNSFMVGWGTAKNILQSSTTGPLAWMSGHFFAPANALRGISLSMAARPQGYAIGWLDKAVQSVTGGRVGFRVDPTVALGIGNAIVRDGAATMAQITGDILSPRSGNFANRFLRGAFGDDFVNVVATRAEHAFEKSIKAEMARYGAGGRSGWSALDLPSVQPGALRAKVYNPANDMVPGLFRVDSRLGGAIPVAVRAKNFFNEINSVISEAAQSNFYRMNRNNPRAASKLDLAMETRSLTGDPGVRGSGGVASVARALPYGNIAIQDIARVFRALHETPGATMAALGGTLGTMALAQVYTAMLAGPEAMRHLQDDLTKDQHSGNFYFYLTHNPMQPAFISLEQRLRVFYPLALQMAHDIFASVELHADDPDFKTRVLNTLTDFFGKHVTHATMDASLTGLSSAVSPPIPSPVQSMLALTGKSFSPTLANVASPDSSSKGLIERMMIPTGGMLQQAGARGVDSLTGSVDGGLIQHAIGSFFGVLGTQVLGMVNDGARVWRQTHDFGAATNEALKGWAENAQESLPLLNGTVWHNDSRLSPRTPMVEAVENKLNSIRPLAKQVGDEPVAEAGYASRNGSPLPTQIVNTANMPKDAVMASLWYDTGKTAQWIDRTVMPYINDDRKAIASLANAVGTREELAAKRNELVADLHKRYDYLTVALRDLEHRSSMMVGGRDVVMERIDWHRGPEQFTPRVQPAPVGR